MVLEWLKPEFTVCKLRHPQQAQIAGDYLFFARTDREFSLVCESQYAPPKTSQRKTAHEALLCAGYDFES